MAIKWTEYESNSSTVKRIWTTHEGLVVGESWTTRERVMSDIYADVSHCTVWNPEKGTTETANLGDHFELCSTFGHATIDASAEILAEVARLAADAKTRFEAAETARIEAARKASEEAARNAPEYGKRMVVFRGRKVPVGTVGKVFWMRDGRVGLALSDRKDTRGYNADVAWVDAAYLKAV